MWFNSGSRSRKNSSNALETLQSSSQKLGTEPKAAETVAASKPTPIVSLTSPIASPSSPKPPIMRAMTSAISQPHDIVLTEIPSRISSASGGGIKVRSGRPSLDTTANTWLQPPTARSQKNPSSVDLMADGEIEGTDRLYDPFSGRPIAALSMSKSPALPTIPSTSRLDVVGKGGNSAMEDQDDPTKQKMWDYLAKIRTLQAEVAAMHLSMDGNGLGDVWGSRSLGTRSRSGSINVGRKSPIVEAANSNLFSESPKKGPGLTSGIAGDSDSEDELIKAKADKTEEEFVELDIMFERKQEALNAVMVKLRELSSVVREYHELAIPNVAFSTSRDHAQEWKATTTESPQPTLNSILSQPPPLHLPPQVTSARLPPIFTSSPTSSVPSTPAQLDFGPAPRLSGERSRSPSRILTSLESSLGGSRQYLPLSAASPAQRPHSQPRNR